MIIQELDNGWKLEADEIDDRWCVWIESMCGQYYSSLGLAIDMGFVEHQEDLSKTKRVPASVLMAGEKLELSLNP